MREPRRPDTIFWVEPRAIQGDILTLDVEESHHLLRVHRAAVGVRFTAVDGVGGTYECVLDSAERSAAVGRIERREFGVGEPPAPITLLVGLPDTGPTETVVEHAVPLGATTIDFVASVRSGRPPLGSARLARLSRLARSALKQSRRSVLPTIQSSEGLGAALERLGEGRRFLADPRGERPLESRPEAAQLPVILAVGPPGGFDDGERALLLEAKFLPMSLVDNRLSTETAAIAILSLARNILM